MDVSSIGEKYSEWFCASSETSVVEDNETGNVTFMPMNFRPVKCAYAQRHKPS